MPGQISTYKIEGQARMPFREAKDLKIQALFGTENVPDLSISEATFFNSQFSNDRDFILDKWQNNPNEGIDVDVEVSDSALNLNYNFKFFTDWKGLRFNADNELVVDLRNSNSVVSFDKRAAGVTFALLEDKGFLNLQDYQNIPYIIENRKTILEKIQLLVQVYNIFKTAADEVFKFINIAADITSAGVVQATLNLSLTIANFILLIQRLVQLMKDIAEAFFPPVLYHSGIKPKTFIEKGAEYLQFDAVEFGNHVPEGATKGFGELMERIVWCPSKQDEHGIPVNVVNPISGALKPGDYGYHLAQAIEYFTEYLNCKKGIINNVLHIRPKSDPFWKQLNGAPVPDVLVETSPIHANGVKRPNYEEYYSNTLLRWAVDDSDYWSNVDLADENDPATSQKIISGVIVEPDQVTNQRRVIAEQGLFYEIPHALCTRKDVVDDLLDVFDSLFSEASAIKDVVQDGFDQVSSYLAQAFPATEPFINTIGGRSGTMKIENHFFSTPKTVFLEDINTGFEVAPRIPTDYAEHIGAKALIQHYHYYNSFVPGIRNPNDLNDTNAKFIFEEVKIRMNLEKFAQILEKPYFTTQNGKEGKYHSIEWDIENDSAVATWWIQEPWMQNVSQKLI